MQELQGSKVCRVCTKAVAKYCCPRCQSPYCSVKCYAEHSEDCTEVFYKEHAVAERNLRDKEDLEKSRSTTIRAIKSVEHLAEKLDGHVQLGANDETQEDEDAFEKIEELIHQRGGSASDPAKLAQVLDEIDFSTLLTKSQKERFERDAKLNPSFIQLDVWEPYWMMEWKEYHVCCAPMVVDMSNVNGIPVDPRLPFFSRQPLVLNPTDSSKFYNAIDSLPPFSSIFSGTVSPSIQYHVVNALVGYVSVMRIYNGLDVGLLPNGSTLEATTLLLEISAVLDTRRTHNPMCARSLLDDDAIIALQSVSLSLQSALVDVCKVLSCSKMLSTALLDLWTILQYSVKHAGSKQLEPGSILPEGFARRHKQASRKAWFFTLWSAAHATEDAIEQLRTELMQVVSEFPQNVKDMPLVVLQESGRPQNLSIVNPEIKTV